jgi:hypothetical protein
VFARRRDASGTFVLTPRDAGPRYADAGIALAARGDSNVRAATAEGEPDAGLRKVQVQAGQELHAALEA